MPKNSCDLKLRWVSALLSTMLLLNSANGHHSKAAEPPNIVVFISDDHGYLDSSLAGTAEFRTPNFERLAAAGMTLSHAFAASPTCAPSRAALLTGLMPNRNGSMLNHQPPRSELKKLPVYLRDLGYEVAAFGKVAHYKQGKDYGFDQVVLDGFHQDKCVTEAVDFLNERSIEKPLCLFVGTNWPHVPWPKRETDRDLSKLQLPPTFVDTPLTRRWRMRYVEAVEQFDRELGQVYDAAYKRLGQNTLFIHFSDQGAQWPFAKWNLYDAGTRVNFVAVWPGVIAPRSRSDAMVSLVDVLPTLVEIGGGSPTSNIDGRSFAGVLTGRQSEHRDRIFTTHSGDGRMNEYPMRSVRTRDWKYIRNLRPETEFTTHINKANSVDGRSYWLSWVERAKNDAVAGAIVERYRRRPAEELYDLKQDPFEQHNLADEPRHAAELAKLQGEVDRWMHEQGDDGLATEEAVAKAFLKPAASAEPVTPDAKLQP